MIIRELVGYEPTGTATNISEALRYLVGVNKKRATTFLLSDFVDSEHDLQRMEDALKIASSKHDIMAIRVFDQRDRELPDVGVVELRDAETGERSWLDTSSRRVREFWQEEFDSCREAMNTMLRQHRVDVAEVRTDGDFVVELLKMFKQR